MFFPQSKDEQVRWTEDSLSVRVGPAVEMLPSLQPDVCPHEPSDSEWKYAVINPTKH